MSKRTYLEGIPKWKGPPIGPRNTNQQNQQAFGRRSRFFGRSFYGRRNFQPHFKTVYNGVEERQELDDNSDEAEEEGSRRRQVRKRVRNQIDRIVGDADGVNSQSPPLKLHRVYTGQNQRNSVLKRMEDLIREDNSDMDWDADEAQSSNHNKQRKADELQTIDVRIQAIAKRIMKLKEDRPLHWAKEIEKLETMQVSLEEKRFDLMQSDVGGSKRPTVEQSHLMRRRSSRHEKRTEVSSHRRQAKSQRQKEWRDDEKGQESSDDATSVQESSDNETNIRQAATKDEIEALRARLTNFVKNLPANHESQPQQLPAAEPVSQVSANKSRRSDVSDPYQTPRQRFSDNDDSTYIKEENMRNALGILPKKLDVDYKGTTDFPFDANRVAARIIGHFPFIPLRESDQRSSYINTCISVLGHRLERARMEMPQENREKSASDEILNRTTSIERQEGRGMPIFDSNAQTDENIFGEDDHLAMEAVVDHPSFYEVDHNIEDLHEDGTRSHSSMSEFNHEKTPPLERIFNETIRGVRERDNGGDFGQTTTFALYGHSTAGPEMNKSHQLTTPIYDKSNSQIIREGLSGEDTPQATPNFREFSRTIEETSPLFFDDDGVAISTRSSQLQVNSRSSSTPSFLRGSKLMFTNAEAHSIGNVTNLMTPNLLFGDEILQQQSRFSFGSFSQERTSQSSRGPFDWFNKFDTNNQFR